VTLVVGVQRFEYNGFISRKRAFRLILGQATTIGLHWVGANDRVFAVQGVGEFASSGPTVSIATKRESAPSGDGAAASDGEASAAEAAIAPPEDVRVAFSLPEKEMLHGKYACSVEDQFGYLYLFSNFLCFDSLLFSRGRPYGLACCRDDWGGQCF